MIQKILLSTALLALIACSPDTQDNGSAAPAAAPPTGAAAEATPPDDGIASSIDVRATWLRPHPQGRDVTAAYFTVYLATGSWDRLLGARIDGAERVELHGHSMDPQTGMMHMEEIGPQMLTPAGPTVFAPGGRHLMVFGLAPVVEGDSVSGVLEFERAGEVPVTFDVRSAPPGIPDDQN